LYTEGSNPKFSHKAPKSRRSSKPVGFTGRIRTRGKRNSSKKRTSTRKLLTYPRIFAVTLEPKSCIFASIVLLVFYVHVLSRLGWKFTFAVYCLLFIVGVTFLLQKRRKLLNPKSLLTQNPKVDFDIWYILAVVMVSLGISVAIPRIVLFSPSRAPSRIVSDVVMTIFKSYTEEYSYVVSLIDRKGTSVCAGTLIAPNIVLSAARCSLFLLVGVKTTGGADTLHEIADFVTHPDWIPDGREHDILLLLLKFPLNKNNVFVDDGCSSVLKEGTELKAFDWNMGKRLMVSKLGYLPNYICKDRFIKAGISIDTVRNVVGKGTLCAAKTNSRETVRVYDSDTGQLGSPLILPYASIEDTDYGEALIGAKDVMFGLVTSLTMSDAKTESLDIGVYVRISNERFWVISVLKEKWDILLESKSECKLEPPPEINSSPIYMALFIVIFYAIILLL